MKETEIVIKPVGPPRDEVYWWNYPRELFRFNLHPEANTAASWVNYVTRMLMYILILVIVFGTAGGEVAASAAIATLIFLSAIDIMMHPPAMDSENCQVVMEDNRGEMRREPPTEREGYSDYEDPHVEAPAEVGNFDSEPKGRTYPTAENPFMNMSVAEIHTNPRKGVAAPITNKKVKQALDDYFRVQWYSDPTDVFGKNQSQRNFITMPSTSVPNDRESLIQWQYGLPDGTCKSGNKNACRAGTDGSPVTWLNQA
jgi:hypothetical protein